MSSSRIIPIMQALMIYINLHINNMDNNGGYGDYKYVMEIFNENLRIKEFKKLKSEFEAKGMSKSVEFMGVIPHEQVRETMAQSDILLFPTRVEAFGLVIAEAMMERTVPVVTLLPGITDATVEDSKTGFLIPMNDVDTFAQRVVMLGKNPQLLEEVSKASLNTAKEKLSLNKCWALCST